MYPWKYSWKNQGGIGMDYQPDACWFSTQSFDIFSVGGFTSFFLETSYEKTNVQYSILNTTSE